MGRVNISYLPFTKGANAGGHYNNGNLVQELDQEYGPGSRYFTERRFEAQSVKTFGPGAAWANRPSEEGTKYYLSTENVFRWSLDANGDPVKGTVLGNFF